MTRRANFCSDTWYAPVLILQILTNEKTPVLRPGFFVSGQLPAGLSII